MICRNCQTEVADDLVFCTECGTRLHETVTDAKTVVLPESVVTKVEAAKPNRGFRIAAIFAGIIALLGLLGVGALLLINPFSSKPVVQNTTPKPVRTPTLKPANQNKSANISENNSNANDDWSNTNSNINLFEDSEIEIPKIEKAILNEWVNIDPDSSVAFPFTLNEDAKIVGEVEATEDQNFVGYVFLQEDYDEHGVKPAMKMFSFETGQVEQFLLKGKYVLVLANEDGNGATVNIRFSQIESNPLK